MTAVRKMCLFAAAGLWVASAAATSHAQLREQPELLKRIWPFFRVQRPVGLLPEGTEAPVEPTDPAKPERPLIAPFVRGKININTCTLAELQNLPGVNASMGAHILAGRPYRNFDELKRDGVPLNVVAGLRNVVTFGSRP